MDPHKLVAALVDRDGGALRVAKAMGRPAFQPTLYKVAAGRVASPKRETAERIAKHFGIPVESLYDRRLATRVFDQVFGGHAGGPLPTTHALRLEDSHHAEYRVPGPPPWPFPRIDQHSLATLPKSAIRDIESAMLTMAAHLGVDIAKRRAA